MKWIIILLIVFSLVLVFSTNVLAHSGGTDNQGGHYDHKTGEYHYHHGTSAHQHYNGRCSRTILIYLLVSLILLISIVYNGIFVFLSDRIKNDKAARILSAVIPLGIFIFEIYYFYF
jgi:hypothetical protein